MRRMIPAVLLLAAACRSAPTEEEISEAVFARLAELFPRFVEVYAAQDPVPLARQEAEIARLVNAHFERVRAGLASEDLERRALAAFGLGFSRNPAAVAPLAEASAHPEGYLRARAIVALGMLGRPEVPVDPFRRLLDDPEWEVRLSAVHGLRHLLGEKEDRGLMPKILEKLEDPVMDVRNETLILLRKIKRAEALDAVRTRGLQDTHPTARANAALALGALGPAAKAANPQLIELLRDENTKVVEAAWTALNRINEKDFDRSYATWRDWYEDELQHSYRCPDHREVEQDAPGECPACMKKLERMPREQSRRTESVPTAYACPDHPEVQTATPSRCGRAGCGKDLVLRKLEVTYVCPDHPEVQTSLPSRCGRPGCGRDLIPKK
ncbi:MAG TPA: HEAT repeat domain-containing protein [Planctomycetota bacterium]|nr:HEAT repeat domain-containing protein [Planctomycetota bacterium]